MSSTRHPTTYSPVLCVKPHRVDHLPIAKKSEFDHERPVLVTSRDTGLEDDDDDKSSPELPWERSSPKSIGLALIAYVMPLVLLPMPLILRENVSIRTVQIVIQSNM